MGFKLNNNHSDEFDICVRTTSLSLIPSKRQVKTKVPGRDGEQVVEDGYDNIKIKMICKIAGEDLSRRKRVREIKIWLLQNGSLILDQESDIEYKVVSTMTNVELKPLGYELPVDEFEIIFECRPMQYNTFYNDGITWIDGEGFLDYLDVPWDGLERIFAVTNGSVINVENLGTYEALPIIKLIGVASSVTIGTFVITNLSGTIYVDCDSKVVYSISGGSKVNQISKFSGSFLDLKPGLNTFTITGTITDLTLEFDYKNTYL